VCTIAKWTTRAILGPAIVFLQNGQKFESFAEKTWSISSLAENSGVILLSRKHIFEFVLECFFEAVVKPWFDDFFTTEVILYSKNGATTTQLEARSSWNVIAPLSTH
jgi:hypothetical protein